MKHPYLLAIAKQLLGPPFSYSRIQEIAIQLGWELRLDCARKTFPINRLYRTHPRRPLLVSCVCAGVSDGANGANGLDTPYRIW
ncbi:hypothetical protein Moror_16379 [Moniliophthora roreri MCA 2997]|uniref:Uncharacterized protein n=1 Tax=Moniliophthora roreri (strain MCA 2997) TaxID=1381753 RepID=V2XDQ5_MONRO|nr:hypothetical protein Moror_16379 [Moniliophthora roreri MCA 2997]